MFSSKPRISHFHRILPGQLKKLQFFNTQIMIFRIGNYQKKTGTYTNITEGSVQEAADSTCPKTSIPKPTQQKLSAVLPERSEPQSEHQSTSTTVNKYSN